MKNTDSSHRWFIFLGEFSVNLILRFRGVSVVRLPPLASLVLVVRGGGGAMEATSGVFPPRLLPLWGVALLMLCRPSLHVALYVGVGHQIDVAVRVALETNQHHT